MTLKDQIDRKMLFINSTLPYILNGGLYLRGNVKLGPHKIVQISRGKIESFLSINKKLYPGELFLDTETSTLYIGGQDNSVFKLKLDKVPANLVIEDSNK